MHGAAGAAASAVVVVAAVGAVVASPASADAATAATAALAFAPDIKFDLDNRSRWSKAVCSYWEICQNLKK